MNSWNPLWANLHVWRDLFRDAWLAPRWIDKLRIWFMPQGWRPEGLPPNPLPPEVTRETVDPLQHAGPAGLECLCVLHFVVALLLAVGLLRRASRCRAASGWWPPCSCCGRLLDIGGIFDHRRWALPVRAPAVAGGGRDSGRQNSGPFRGRAGGLAVAVVAMWVFLLKHRRHFDGAPQPPSRVIGRRRTRRIERS